MITRTVLLDELYIEVWDPEDGRPAAECFVSFYDLCKRFGLDLHRSRQQLSVMGFTEVEFLGKLNHRVGGLILADALVWLMLVRVNKRPATERLLRWQAKARVSMRELALKSLTELKDAP